MEYQALCLKITYHLRSMRHVCLVDPAAGQGVALQLHAKEKGCNGMFEYTAMEGELIL
jgi:hypothetical protein